MAGILPRDAYHAERLYWMNNPPKRKRGQLTAKEASIAMGVGIGVVYKLVKDGRLKASSQRPLMLKAKDVDAYMLAKLMGL